MAVLVFHSCYSLSYYLSYFRQWRVEQYGPLPAVRQEYEKLEFGSGKFISSRQSLQPPSSDHQRCPLLMIVFQYTLCFMSWEERPFRSSTTLTLTHSKSFSYRRTAASINKTMRVPFMQVVWASKAIFCKCMGSGVGLSWGNYSRERYQGQRGYSREILKKTLEFQLIDSRKALDTIVECWALLPTLAYIPGGEILPVQPLQSMYSLHRPLTCCSRLDGGAESCRSIYSLISMKGYLTLEPKMGNN